MQRRTFFGWILSSLVGYVFPRWTWAQGGVSLPADSAMLRELAQVVLPASLGAPRLEAAVKQFEEWVREYRAGAEMSAGYGISRGQTVAPNPAEHYTRQLRDLEAAAQAKGGTFASLDPSMRAGLVAAALEAARVDGLPRRPTGGHVASDLMSHFFFINDNGHDWLYGAAIERTRCRGLASSAERPPQLT